MGTEERLDGLEARLRKAEDHLAILNLLNSYGPLADSASAEDAALLWSEEGSYSFTPPTGGEARLDGRTEIAEMYALPAHLALVEAGSAHLTATPRIAIAGDQGHAVGYSFVILREGDRWIVLRAAINHWTLRRTDQGWRITQRDNRLLDGSPHSHALMRKVLALDPDETEQS